MPLTVTQLTDRLMASYAHAGGINHLDGKNLPSKRAIALITGDLLRLLFPGFFDEKLVHSSEIKAETTALLERGARQPGRRESPRASNTIRRPNCPRKGCAPSRAR